MNKISIILPVYNVEKYLVDCLNSIIEQVQFNCTEILLIDDGSTDGSGDLCDQFAAQYENVSVYHKINGGLSDARNYGLERAAGDYVLFVDSDDCLGENAISCFIDEIEKCNSDIVIADAITIDEKGRVIENPDFHYVHVGLDQNRTYTGQEAMKAQLSCGRMQTTVWLGLYRKAFLVDNQLWFRKGLLHEDELWSAMVFIEAASVRYIEKKTYAYRIRSNSIMRNQTCNHSKNIESIIYVYSYLAIFYDEKIRDQSLSVLVKNDMAGRYLYTIGRWNFAKYPELLKRVNRKEILRNSKSIKNRMRAVIFLLNAKLYCWISRKMMH